MDEKRIFKADKFSGLEGVNFALSVVLELIQRFNSLLPVKLHFYGLTFDLVKNQSVEYIKNDLYEAETNKLLDYIKKNGTSLLRSIASETTKDAEVLRKLALEEVKRIPKLSHFELVNRYTFFMNEYARRYAPPVITFLYETTLSERLEVSIRQRYENASEIISSLLYNEYKSFMIESESALKKIYAVKNKAKQRSLIEHYKKQFFYIHSSYRAGPVLDSDMVFEMAEEAAKYDINKNKRIKNTATLTDEEKLIASIFQFTEVIRDQRKKLNLIGSYAMFRFLEEVSRRGTIPIEIAGRAFWNEYADLVFHPEESSKILEERTHASIVCDGASYHYLPYNAISSRSEIENSDGVLRGSPASKGKVSGHARIVLGSEDFGKFQSGEILIATMTRPDFVTIMKKARAVVTDEGGLTCHAAIVARELNIPCIVGTKLATKVFKDGDLIEVDSETATVRKIL